VAAERTLNVLDQGQLKNLCFRAIPFATSRRRADRQRTLGRPADDGSRVHGLEGLRVIDASVMPAATSANTNAPAMIKGAARERLAAQRR
jgi:GMC oxidoreductase